MPILVYIYARSGKEGNYPWEKEDVFDFRLDDDIATFLFGFLVILAYLPVSIFVSICISYARVLPAVNSRISEMFFIRVPVHHCSTSGFYQNKTNSV